MADSGLITKHIEQKYYRETQCLHHRLHQNIEWRYVCMCVLDLL